MPNPTEKNTILANGSRLRYVVKEVQHTNHVQLKLKPTLDLEISIPTSSNINVQALLKKKTKWIERKYQQVLHTKRILLNGRFLYKGTYRNVSDLPPDSEGGLKSWMKSRTRRIVALKLARFSSEFGFPSAKVGVQEMRKWGYCNKNGSLAFNWQLCALPDKLIDYVILHELVHLKKFNHSRSFRYLLASVCPDFEQREALLKEYIAS